MSIEIKKEEENRSQGLFSGVPDIVDEKPSLAVIQSLTKSMNRKINILLFLILSSFIYSIWIYTKSQDELDKAIEDSENQQKVPSQQQPLPQKNQQ